MADETEFNRYAAGEFIAEYRREIGVLLQFKNLGNPFPDVLLEATDGRAVGVEFVSVVLAFINQEHRYFDRYRQAFLTEVKSQAPRYGHVIITLQPHHQHALRARPIRLPDMRRPEGRQLVAEFAQLLDDRFEDLSTNCGGKEGLALLDLLRTPDGTLCYPILSKYFGVITFRHKRIQEASRSGATPEDPVIENPVVWYSNAETAIAIRRALSVKAEKGTAYSSDLLVVHTLPKPGVRDVSGIEMNVDELARLAQALLAEMPELASRFREIWLLNRSITDGKRLYRLD